ncbi:hypothetical protein ACIBI9_45365 [Nonomuraea sp. NPDC050451]|uniref:hypothetical protein n=1 Tax=Nonomuraea sp. NPDC050451 TaxID=3364364 RepID=UPI00378DD629
MILAYPVGYGLRQMWDGPAPPAEERLLGLGRDIASVVSVLSAIDFPDPVLTDVLLPALGHVRRNRVGIEARIVDRPSDHRHTATELDMIDDREAITPERLGIC